MERAVRVSSAEKGYDPRDITLVAFGGAGPMHAAALAKAVGIPTVLVPERPGVFSAVGLMMSDIRHDYVQTRTLRGAEINGASLDPLYRDLDGEAHAALERDGVREDRRQLQRSADLRYVGQAYEVNVPVPTEALDDRTAAVVVQAFHDLHQQLYAHHHPDKPVEFVSGRVAAIGLMEAPELRRRSAGDGILVSKERRLVYYEETDGIVETDVYDRDALSIGAAFEGPAVVEQADTTTVIHPRQRAHVDEMGNLLIEIGS